MADYYLTYGDLSDDLKAKIEEGEAAQRKLNEAVAVLMRLSYWSEEKETLSRARGAAGNVVSALHSDAIRTLKGVKK